MMCVRFLRPKFTSFFCRPPRLSVIVGKVVVVVKGVQFDACCLVTL